MREIWGIILERILKVIIDEIVIIEPRVMMLCSCCDAAVDVQVMAAIAGSEPCSSQLR